MAKEHGIHTAVETSLQVPWRSIEDCLPFIDLLLADVKHVDPARFRLGTRGSSEMSTGNFARLASLGVEMIARIPLIPNFNADRDSIAAIISFIGSCRKNIDIHVLPYHVFGRKKYDMLDLKYVCDEYSLKDSELLEFSKNFAQERGMNITIGG